MFAWKKISHNKKVREQFNKKLIDSLNLTIPAFFFPPCVSSLEKTNTLNVHEPLIKELIQPQSYIFSTCLIVFFGRLGVKNTYM